MSISVFRTCLGHKYRMLNKPPIFIMLAYRLPLLGAGYNIWRFLPLISMDFSSIFENINEYTKIIE